MMTKDTGFIELKKDIRENNLKNIYLFYGNEAFIKEVYINKFKELINHGGFPDFNHIVLDEKSMDFAVIDDSIESFPMMVENKLVIIKNSGIFHKPKEEIKEFWQNRLQTIPEYVTIIFTEIECDKRSALFKAVSKLGRTVEFEYLTETDMVAWIEREARAGGKIISKNNATYMASICGEGLSYVKNELDKLMNFCEKEITLSDINRMVSKSLSVKVFELTDAIMSGNSQKALSLMNDFKTVKEPAFKILYLLSGTFDKMLRCKLMLSEGASYNEIAEKTKLKPFIVKKYTEGAKTYDENYLIDRIIRVADIDLDIKEGNIDEWTALEQYVIESLKK